MKQITVSAPGKLMLLGEHAVVYDQPCLVTAVDTRMTASVSRNKEKRIKIDAPQIDVQGFQKSLEQKARTTGPKGFCFAEAAVNRFYQKFEVDQGVNIRIVNGFSRQFGLGSSSAVSVCLIKSLAEIFNQKLSQKEIFDLAYQAVLDIQGVGSGFDVAAAVWGGTIYFLAGGKKIIPIKTEKIPLVIAYGGVKADTPTMVRKVQAQREEKFELVERIFEKIRLLVEEARVSLEKGDWPTLGRLMTKNHELLGSLEVSTAKLDQLAAAALKAGAWGAKLSGAGGGDCLIVLVEPKNKHQVEKALVEAGGSLVPLQTGAEGVRVE